MPNGFHGTAEEWQRLEEPLRSLDVQLDRFALSHRARLTRNYHDYPERSLTWRHHGIRRLIQIYLADPDRATFNVWICASRDRLWGRRRWKREYLRQNATIASIRTELTPLLDAAWERVESWLETDLEPV